jgi:hypothetical protein
MGFNGPPDPLGTKAFERAVEMINALPTALDLVLITGDLTHETEEKDVHAKAHEAVPGAFADLRVSRSGQGRG